MTTARSYDRLNRLMGISSIPAGASQLPLSFQYSYNDANQRVRVGLHDGSYWLSIQAVAGANSASSTGSVFLAKTPEVFVHDTDGNLTQDGRWIYIWDGENRLVAMDALSAVPAAAKLRVEFEYDWRGRRIGKTVKSWSGTSYTSVYVLKFLYDGWNLVAEVSTNNVLVRSYLWGMDLSGSFQGAGGVGGLLAVNVATNRVHFPAYDGNANIAGLVSAASGAITARYEYGPFAEPIRVSGQVAKAMPLRFSTKHLDEETGLYYYGYRYYDPSAGRWTSRDCTEEQEGTNLYLAFLNNALTYVDRDGRDNWSDPSSGQNAVSQVSFPVSGPNYPVGPSYPYAPGGAFYRVSTLLSAKELSFLDNFGYRVSNTHETQWFLRDDPRAAKASQAAEKYFRENLAKKVCGLLKETSIPSFFVSPASDPRGNYSFEQPYRERSYVLGWYEYRLVGLNTTRAGSVVRWKAEIAIVDKLGWDRDEYGIIFTNLAGHVFSDWLANWMGKRANDATVVIYGAPREFLRGNYVLAGETDCCSRRDPQ